VSIFWAIVFLAVAIFSFVASGGARGRLQAGYIVLGLILVVFAVRDVVVPFSYGLGYWLGMSAVLATGIMFELERRSLYKRR
jgi:hypothetical protein